MAGMGTYNDLLASSSLFCHLLDDIHQKKQEPSVDLQHEDEQERSVELQHEDEQERSVDLRREQLTINSTSSQKENKRLMQSTSVETKQTGRLKWRVYVAYLRAGAGIIVGFLLVSLVSAVQQAAYIFSSWWLAAWNDDEGYRHMILNNCTTSKQNNTIWYMTDAEWNHYRNRRFYIYCGLCTFCEFIL
jgi:hypothetical protein